MKCKACRTSKHTKLIAYGGLELCEHCYDKYNPIVKRYTRLSEQQRTRLINDIKLLMEKASILTKQLNIDNKLIEENKQYIDYKISKLK